MDDRGAFRQWFGQHAEDVLAARDDPARLAMLFAESAVPMVLADNRRHYIDANELALRALGLTYETMLTFRMDDLTPPYLLADLEESWARLLDTGVLMGDEVAGMRSYVALPWYAVANVLPGRHVVVFIPHSVTPDDLPSDGVEPVQQPDAPLTPRELEVLGLAANGLNAPKIADRLVLSAATVRTHFENIYRKLEVPDRAAAVAKAMRLGLIR
jgi:DNA-binding CsgD family transcriptional regulator